MTTNYGLQAVSYSTARGGGKSRAVLDHLKALRGELRDETLPEVKPLQAKCRYCGAEPGERCIRWRKSRSWRVKQVRHSPHRDRVYDAQQATQMARTLITGEEQP